MTRRWHFSWLTLFLATLSGLFFWGGTAWFLEHKPQYIDIKDFLPSEAFQETHQRQAFQLDATGKYFVMCFGESLADGRLQWIVHDLKTGTEKSLAWHADINQPAVPIKHGYRHFRIASDGTLEIVDTYFPDGTSHVRLHLPLGTRIASSICFNHDGSRVITLHLFPHSLLRVLGNLNGPAWDALAVAHLQNQCDQWFQRICCDALIARVWDVDSGKCLHEFMLPPLTTTQVLQMSPNGRWLVRSETGLLPDNWFMFPTKDGAIRATKPGECFFAAEPRGVLAFDCQTGLSLPIPVNQQDNKIGAFSVDVNDTGISFSHIMMMPNSDSGISTYVPLSQTITNDFVPFHRFPDGKKVGWVGISGSHSTSDIAPIRTIDGYDVSIVRTDRRDALAIVSLDDDGMRIRSAPIELPAESSIHIEPTNQPGLVFATWRNTSWPRWALTLASKLSFDLNTKFPRTPSFAFALVDIHQSKILLEQHTIFDPTKAGPEYNLTHDGSAILLFQFRDRDLHLIRWDLPLSLWSPWWSRAAGLLTAILIWLLLSKATKRKSIQLSLSGAA